VRTETAPAAGVTARVGDGLNAAPARWTFGGDVSRHFDDHVTRSVPRYEEGHRMVLALSEFFLAPGSRCYELGCSTGALTRLLAEHNEDREVLFIGVDREPAMVERATERCADLTNVEILHEDVVTMEFVPADLIVAYYTIQFMAPKVRQVVLNRIFEALNWGGALVMFEKVRAPDARFQEMLSQLYTEFKLMNGYSPTEILAKTRSLKGVLEPFSSQGNEDMLRRAGFADTMPVMKTMCFEGVVAIK
jgi:tRNA (cmo5U34)-methyltransferase